MNPSLGSPARRAFHAWSAAHGQLFFAASPATGLAALVGLALIAPHAAATGALAGGAATMVALVLRYPPRAWLEGLYGYAAVLAGLYWSLLFAPTAGALGGLAVAAAVSPALTRLAHRLLTPRGIPTLALPALVPVWIASALLEPAGVEPTSVPAFSLAGAAVILAGLLVHSRLLAGAAAIGAATAGAVSAALTGHLETGLVVNGVAAAIALGAVYLPWCAASVVLAALAAAVAALAWWLLAAAWPPLLLAPFNAVTVLALLALRAHGLRRALRCPAPLPLEGIATPERARAAWQARRRLADLARRARRITALTGAGVSTGAGLPDVRGAFGLWLRERGLTLDEFVASPDTRAEYWRRETRFGRLVERAEPADAHRALAALDRLGRLSAVVTQNVDGLHQAAGLPRERVIELHGNLREARCLDCGLRLPRERLGDVAGAAGGPHCDRCRGLLVGGGLLFGEPVSRERLDAALRALLDSDLLLVLGTSLAVAPASHMLAWAGEAGVPVAIVNATPTAHDQAASVIVTADVGAVLRELLDGEERAVRRRRRGSGGRPAPGRPARSCTPS